MRPHARTAMLFAASAALAVACVGAAVYIPAKLPSGMPPAAPADASPCSSGACAPLPAAAAAPLRIRFAGDVMMGRNVESLMQRHGESYPFARLGDFLQRADLTVLNLEGPIPVRHARTPSGSTVFNFLPSVAPLLAAQGVDLVSLANNHSLDGGNDGFANTAAVLEAAGLAHIGHYSREGHDSWSAVLRGRRVTLIGLNMIEPAFDAKAAVAWAKKTEDEHGDDALVAVLHWGNEYVHTAGAVQRRLARELIDAGVDAVIGMHAHVVQDIDVYKGKMIFYSLGNFIFDQYFSQATQEGLALEMAVSDGPEEPQLRFLLLPVESARSQPALMTGERKEKFLQWLASISAKELQEQIAAGEIAPSAALP